MIKKIIPPFFFFLIIPYFSFALTLSGLSTDDFPDTSCTSDLNGQSVGIPSGFPAGTISGFDADEICVIYNQPEDTLYVGVKTFTDTASDPLIFGDADGDGDPASTGADLDALDGDDIPNLGNEEYFAFVVDFDNNLSTTPDAVAGISVTRSAPSGFRVSEVSGSVSINSAGEDIFYGSLLSGSTDSELFANPSALNPHLEFTITNFSSLPGFSGLDVSDPSAQVLFVFQAGSFADKGIGEEDVRFSLLAENFFDADGDDIVDSLDTDSDNDGLSDDEENNLGTDPFDADTDDDGVSDGDEIDLGTDPLSPGIGEDPDIHLSDSTNTVQVQGGGCSLRR